MTISGVQKRCGLLELRGLSKLYGRTVVLDDTGSVLLFGSRVRIREALRSARSK